jgi:2-dehydro-3-deoxyphosphogluconate aldolase/(4S)-4-hydroxy-2-oxoglutarate aldolase
MRSADGSILVDAAEALLAGGVIAIELTFTVPRAAQVLEQVAARLGDRAVVGAGTVLDSETARIALLSGAQFVVSPTVSLPVIELCRRYGKLVMPGALTPTEVLAAWQAGADVVKVFPCDAMGPGYLKALAAPLPQVRLMPTGGITLENAAEYIRAGACALGVGGSLVDPAALAARDLARLQQLARQFADAVRGARGAKPPAGSANRGN